MNTQQQKIQDAFRDIIDGQNVKRIKHELTYDGRDLTQEFIDELQRHGYMPRSEERRVGKECRL